MRLIDADALKDNFFDYAPLEMMWDRADIGHKIDEMPAVDAVPVIHGRWVFHEENGPTDVWLTCSVCGKESGVHKGNYYCHWCGAKMDSERRDSE